MSAAVADAGHRRTTVLHVTGDAGLGKSRLLIEACRLATDAGADVLTGAAGDTAGLTPFALVRSVIERAQDSRPTRSLGRYLGVPADDVDVLLGTAGEAASLRRWREVMRRAMTNLAARGPVLLALDDVHWADDQSLDVIASLARRPPPSGFVLLLGYRARPETTRLLAGTGPDVASTPGFSVRRLELGGFGRDEIAALFPDSGPARRAALLDATGGNPFFVDALHRQPSVDPGSADDREAVPPVVRHTLAAELEPLSSDVRALVEVAAVLGPMFDPHLVAEASDQTFEATLHALDQARAHGICAPLEVGTALAVPPPAAPARHLPGAGGCHSGLRAPAHLAGAGGERCVGRGASAPCRGHGPSRRCGLRPLAGRSRLRRRRPVTDLGRALALDRPHAARHRRRRRRSRRPAGPLQRQHRTRRAARGARRGARRRRHVRRDRQSPCRCRAFRAHLDQLLGRHAESDAMLSRELGSRQTRPDADRQVDDIDRDVALLIDLATTRLMRGDFEQARIPAEQAVSAAASSRRQARPGLFAGSWSLHALVAMADGDHERAVADRTTAARSVDALTDSELAEHLEAGLWLGWVEMFHEQYADGLRHLARCLDIARRGTHQHLMTHLLVGYGSLLKLRGDLPAAAEAFDEAAEIAHRTQSAELIGMAAAMQCRVATWLGDHDRARRLGERAVQETSEHGSWFDTVARAVLAQAHLVAGDASTVVHDLVIAGGGELLPRFDPATRCDWWEVLTRAALADEDAPDVATATRYAELATQTADELPLQSPQAAAALACAHVAAAQDDWAKASAAALDAADGFAIVGNRLEQGRALLAAGTSYAADGARRDGLDVLRLADAAFAECSAAHLQAQTRALMRRLGVRLPTQGRRSSESASSADGEPVVGENVPQSLGVLSRREQEVAALVGVGLTNRQIAADLVLSEKTVESHLSHIFTKLGVGSRAAVASAVERSRRYPRATP